MTPFSIAHGWLDEVTDDSASLRRLLEAGEYLLVDRKEAFSLEGFACTVAAMANGEGGWILLGVEDRNGPDGPVIKGFREDETDPSAWLGNKLLSVIDPAPVVAAKVVRWNGQALWAVRVLASSSPPHVVFKKVRNKSDVTETEAVIYVRVYEQKSKLDGSVPARFDRSVASRAELTELMSRGARAESEARAKILEPARLPLIASELLLPSGVVGARETGFGSTAAPADYVARSGQPSLALRLVPVNALPWFASRVLSEDGLAAARAGLANFTSGLFDAKETSDHDTGSVIRQRGYAIRARKYASQHSIVSVGSRNFTTLVVDAGGCLGLGLLLSDEHRPSGDGPDRISVHSLKSWIARMVSTIAGLSEAYGVLGPCLLDLRAAEFDRVALNDLSTSSQRDGRLESGRLQMGGEIMLPTDGSAQLDETVEAWIAEWSRAAGAPSWLPPETDSPS